MSEGDHDNGTVWFPSRAVAILGFQWMSRTSAAIPPAAGHCTSDR